MEETFEVSVFVWGRMLCKCSPRSSVQPESSRTARHDGDLSLEGEDVGEIGQLDLLGGRHGGCGEGEEGSVLKCSKAVAFIELADTEVPPRQDVKPNPAWNLESGNLGISNWTA